MTNHSQRNSERRTANEQPARPPSPSASVPIDASRGFTILELLVVIAIIGILIGLLFPAIRGAIVKSKETKARTEMLTIVHAVRQFSTEYGKLPTNHTADVSYGADYANTNLVAILTGLNTTANPRKLIFLEIPPSSLSDGNFVDPWQNQYEITIDANYNNTVQAASGLATNVANNVIAVWSKGSDRQVGTADDLKSWE